MIRLHTFRDCLPGTPDPSGFVVKLMTVLRLSGVGHERVEEDNPAAGPRGKVPFIRDNDVVMGDTVHILAYLKEARGVDLDQHLTPLQKAQSHALQRMLEERLYWACVYSRWMEPTNRAPFLKLIFAPVPRLLRGLVARQAEKSVKAALYYHGLGRHTREEIYALGVADIETVATVLGDKSFLFGHKPCVADATAFGMLVNIVGPDIASPLKEAVAGSPTLMAYVTRMQMLFDSAAPAPLQHAA